MERTALKDINGNEIVIAKNNIAPNDIDLSEFKNESTDAFVKQSNLNTKVNLNGDNTLNNGTENLNNIQIKLDENSSIQGTVDETGQVSPKFKLHRYTGVNSLVTVDAGIAHRLKFHSYYDKGHIAELFVEKNEGSIDAKLGNESYPFSTAYITNLVSGSASVNVSDLVSTSTLSDYAKSSELKTVSDKLINVSTSGSTTSFSGNLDASGNLRTYGYVIDIKDGVSTTINLSQLNTKVDTIKNTYLKNATISGNILTITKQDDSTVTFSGGGGGGLSGLIDYNSISPSSSLSSSGNVISNTNNFAGYAFARTKPSGYSNLVIGRSKNNSSDSGNTKDVDGVFCFVMGNKSRATGLGCLSFGGDTVAGNKINWSKISGGTIDDDTSLFCAAFGEYSEATGRSSLAIGYSTKANKKAALASGANTVADGDYSHAEGYQTKTMGLNSHAEGNTTLAQGDASHAEGDQTKAYGKYSHTEGYNTTVRGNHSHAEGSGNNIIIEKLVPVPPQPSYKLTGTWKFHDICTMPQPGINWSKQGISFTANDLTYNWLNVYSNDAGTFGQIVFRHSSGEPAAKGINNGNFTSADNKPWQTIIINGEIDLSDNTPFYNWFVANADKQTPPSPPVDYDAIAGQQAHAEGTGNEVLGYASHAEGVGNHSYAPFSHVEGMYCTVGKLKINPEDNTKYILDSGKGASACGYQTKAEADYSRATGIGTIAGYEGQVVTGKFNSNKSDTIFEVGNGNSALRQNAFEVLKDGTIRIPNYTNSTLQSRSGYKRLACINGVLTVID